MERRRDVLRPRPNVESASTCCVAELSPGYADYQRGSSPASSLRLLYWSSSVAMALAANCDGALDGRVVAAGRRRSDARNGRARRRLQRRRWVDVYVANGGDANRLWINQPDQARSRTRRCWRASPSAGWDRPEGMGIDLGDIDGGGGGDLFVASLDGEAASI